MSKINLRELRDIAEPSRPRSGETWSVYADAQVLALIHIAEAAQAVTRRGGVPEFDKLHAALAHFDFGASQHSIR